MERIDDREDYGEIRFIALGRVDTEVYRVVFTWRGENLIRIVSAQKASRDEREIYHRATFPYPDQSHAPPGRGQNQPGCARSRVSRCGLLEKCPRRDSEGQDLRSSSPRH